MGAGEGGERLGKGGNGGKQQLPLCDGDGDRDGGHPTTATALGFAIRVGAPTGSVPEGLRRPWRVPWAGMCVLVSSPQLPESTMGLIPQDEEPQERPLAGLGALLSLVSPKPTSGVEWGGGCGRGFWSWTVPGDAGGGGGTSCCYLPVCWTAPPEPPSSHLLCSKQLPALCGPQPALSPAPLCHLPPHFPSWGGNINQEGVRLVVFSPSVATLCVERLDSAFGQMLQLRCWGYVGGAAGCAVSPSYTGETEARAAWSPHGMLL